MSATETIKRELAMAAAHAAIEAAQELIRYAREGEAFAATFDPDVEVFEKLCDAAKMAAEVDAKEFSEGVDADYREARGQIVDALVRFLEGWA